MHLFSILTGLKCVKITKGDMLFLDKVLFKSHTLNSFLNILVFNKILFVFANILSLSYRSSSVNKLKSFGKFV